MTDFRQLGARLSNWARWDTQSERDERGTTNLITPDRSSSPLGISGMAGSSMSAFPSELTARNRAGDAGSTRSCCSPRQAKTSGSRTRSTTRTATCECHDRERLNGTASRTCSTTGSCTTVSGPPRLGRDVPYAHGLGPGHGNDIGRNHPSRGAGRRLRSGRSLRVLSIRPADQGPTRGRLADQSARDQVGKGAATRCADGEQCRGTKCHSLASPL